MKIKWKSVYWPIGEWVDESGNKVDIAEKNLKAKLDGIDILVLMVPQYCKGGHGEPSITADIPMYFNAETLENISIDGFVEVDD